MSLASGQDGDHVPHRIYEEVNAEDLEWLTDTVRTTNGRPNTGCGGNAAGPDMATITRNGQDILCTMHRKKEEQVRQRCWYLWTTKGGREEVLNHCETEKDEKDTATT